jgi:hypothetical protein
MFDGRSVRRWNHSIPPYLPSSDNNLLSPDAGLYRLLHTVSAYIIVPSSPPALQAVRKIDRSKKERMSRINQYLFEATRENNLLAEIDRRLNVGANVNAKDSRGFTPLIMAPTSRNLPHVLTSSVLPSLVEGLDASDVLECYYLTRRTVYCTDSDLPSSAFDSCTFPSSSRALSIKIIETHGGASIEFGVRHSLFISRSNS